jgi:L-fucose mutarotase/ribose pyranase (RbsD/FucU family)
MDSVKLNRDAAATLVGVLIAAVLCAVMKDAIVSFKLDKTLKAKIIALAKVENRSLSNFIEKVLKEEIARQESRQGRGK